MLGSLSKAIVEGRVGLWSVPVSLSISDCLPLTLFLCPGLGHFLIFISFQTVLHVLRKESELSNSRQFL